MELHDSGVSYADIAMLWVCRELPSQNSCSARRPGVPHRAGDRFPGFFIEPSRCLGAQRDAARPLAQSTAKVPTTTSITPMTTSTAMSSPVNARLAA